MVCQRPYSGPRSCITGASWPQWYWVKASRGGSWICGSQSGDDGSKLWLKTWSWVHMSYNGAVRVMIGHSSDIGDVGLWRGAEQQQYGPGYHESKSWLRAHGWGAERWQFSPMDGKAVWYPSTRVQGTVTLGQSHCNDTPVPRRRCSIKDSGQLSVKISVSEDCENPW